MCFELSDLLIDLGRECRLKAVLLHELLGGGLEIEMGKMEVVHSSP
jgi:hypothetical protein